MSLTDWLDGYEDRDWQTATEGTVRYALIGLGWWATDVAMPAIADSELGETTVLVSSSTEKATRLANEHDVSRGITYDELKDGEASKAYDAVYVCTPNAYHLEYVEAAAELGKGIVCEKPMEASVERAEEMVEVCEREDAPLMIAYRMQTEPAVRRARELIEAGFVGEPMTVYGHNSQPLLEMIPDPDQWRLTPDLTGYGTSVMDLGIYSINTARYLLDRDPVAVQSMMATEHEAFEGLEDERASFMLDFDGVEMVSTATQNGQEDSQLTITGTEGQVEIRPAFPGTCRLHVRRGDQSLDFDREEFGAVEEMREEFDYFADRLLTDAPIEPDGEHGLHDLRTIEAIHEAAETGDIVGIQ
ncbi:D-xylose 1-dehydrogenase Gfo6 [Halococcus sp. IIIV-5B]|uniref:D-xylose 1-dehydrogenase Gfo6 n=1 Tax=Halococcus sp. IIIV-5B TaxID=2321230 RepID=UPI000E7093DE|nr:D-xylose 1-dehydrogenase Gfo6 [Halococcus sp. IIIV-5B]RJT07181.1 gfo/Idh/MocA family oxidoreductase [Halococcus sp. IIIV-5B]